MGIQISKYESFTIAFSKFNDVYIMHQERYISNPTILPQSLQLWIESVYNISCIGHNFFTSEEKKYGALNESEANNLYAGLYELTVIATCFLNNLDRIKINPDLNMVLQKPFFIENMPPIEYFADMISMLACWIQKVVCYLLNSNKKSSLAKNKFTRDVIAMNKNLCALKFQSLKDKVQQIQNLRCTQCNVCIGVEIKNKGVVMTRVCMKCLETYPPAAQLFKIVNNYCAKRK